jgi:tRNA A-37 threonylcarbamoyl transferase component Bud32
MKHNNNNNKKRRTMGNTLSHRAVAYSPGYFLHPQTFVDQDKQNEKTIPIDTQTLSIEADQSMLRYIHNRKGWEYYKDLKGSKQQIEAERKWIMIQYVPYMLQHAYCTKFQNPTITFAGAGINGCTFLVTSSCTPENNNNHGTLKAVKFQLYHESIIQEIQLAQEFSKSGFGVPINQYCFAQFDNTFWVTIIVMDKVDGVLTEILRSKDELPPHIIQSICEQIISAINAMDQLNIHHCDLNSGNIGFIRTPDNQYQIKLIDFGLASRGSNLRHRDVLSFLRAIFDKFYNKYPNARKIQQYFQQVGNDILQLPDDDLLHIIDEYEQFNAELISARYDLYFQGKTYRNQVLQGRRNSILLEASQSSITRTGTKGPLHDYIINSSSLPTREKTKSNV